MLEKKLLQIIANFLEIDEDDLSNTSNLLYEYDLDEDQLECLADIITEETGKYTSGEMIESSGNIKKLAKEMNEF